MLNATHCPVVIKQSDKILEVQTFLGNAVIQMIWRLAPFRYLWTSSILLVGYVYMMNQGTTVDWQRLSGQRMRLWSGSGAKHVVARLF